MLLPVSLLCVTVAFVFLCGANDGGALLAVAVAHRARGRVAVLLLLGVAVAMAPAVFGLTVARTFTDRLFAGSAGYLPLVFLAGVAAATLLVVRLTARGIPTSMTLALLGALSGAALGLGAAPAWGHLVVVLGIGIAAPFCGVLVGYLLGLAARRVPGTAAMPGRVRLVQGLAFAGQCLAYAANDGQKMFAVVAVATAALGSAADIPLAATSLAIAVVFTAGSIVSLRRIGRGATLSLIPARPWHVASAEVASSVAVLGSSMLGMPVSMTQSAAGGLVGTALTEGPRRVRWQFTVPMFVAWLVTLPAGFGAGLLAGLGLEGMMQWMA
ncbi:inorganic phosphate transporter [Amycolatopsis jejuensis]|uniref:inorganic phosphate transporter n=1 Tax=Amycolatopsis jejuensis TaxID=330084 RepID=UPI000527309F|nr:inorganic phosphate transporter [Amycolatopsis jejuensis]